MRKNNRPPPPEQIELPTPGEPQPEVADESAGEDFASLGQYLRRERELRRISIDEIARVTRINRRHLELLEAGEEGKLPAAPFLKGFLVAYARHIGIDPDEVLNRYIELTPAVESGGGTAVRTQSRRPRAIWLAAVAIILLALAGWWMMAARRAESPDGADTQAETPTDPATGRFPAPDPPPQSADAPPPGQASGALDTLQPTTPVPQPAGASPSEPTVAPMSAPETANQGP
jgi:cytoskeletal protein RodZ